MASAKLFNINNVAARLLILVHSSRGALPQRTAVVNSCNSLPPQPQLLMRDTLPDRVRLGAFQVDLRAGELREGERTIYLQEQPLFVLRMLVERAGELVTRDEIKQKLWPNDTVVDFDLGINAAIRRVRLALGDSADEPRYLETIARRGYRLLVPVEASPSIKDIPPSEFANQEALGGEPSQSSAAAGTNLIGKKVSHYRVLEVIGGGGMGMVYKAEDLKLGRQVALKFLPEELAWDAAALQRFEREARAASSLDHPSICTIYEVEEHDGQPFIVMQLLQGETLRDRLAALAADHKKLALDELLDIATQICDGLQAAHEKGVIHRDIKPANIFLTSTGQVKILDFGLAKLVSAVQEVESDGLQLQPDSTAAAPRPARSVPLDATLTRLGVAMGTAGYMSPEQVRCEQVDARSDLFSFGLVLYEMATGQRAFTGETAAVVHNAILNQTPIPTRELNPAVTPAIEAILNRALEKDRRNRYQTAAELSSELQRIKKANQEKRRWPRWLAAALVVLTAGLAASWIASRRVGAPTKRVKPEVVEQQLTANPQGDYITGAAISPDGKYVAYQDQTGFYLRSLQSGETHSVALPARLSGRIVDLNWIPGGEKLLATVADASGSYNIWVISVPIETGPNLRLLSEAQSYLLYPHGMESAVSPDGQGIVFTRWEVGELAHEVWVGGVNGESPRKLVATGGTGYVFSPVWSPDGRWIAYGRAWPTGEGSYTAAIEVRPSGGGPARTLVAESTLPNANSLMLGDTYWFNASWSPDWRLLFSVTGGSESQTKYSVWTVRVDPHTIEASSKPERLTPWSDFAPRNQTITADGKRLSFLKERQWMDVYLGELGPGGTSMKTPRRFTLDDRGSDASAWVREGQAVLFNSKRNGLSAIFEQGLNQHTADVVVAATRDAKGGKASPDGTWILYAESAGALSDSYQLMRQATGGGSPETVLDELDYGRTDNFWCSSNPKASFPCVLGLLTGEDVVFYSLDPVRGKGSQLGKIEVVGKYMGWGISPDGSRVALVDRDRYGARIEVLTLADGIWHEIALEPKTGALQSIAWAADGKSFFVTAWTPDSYNLLHVTSGGKVQLLLRNRRNQWLHNPLPSPEGKHLAFSAETWDSNVWMVENF